MDTSTAAPSLSDDVAITALIISLIALLIGISSFLQAILGTAEGFRRCASSVIGPWSKLRRRVFRWSEFRFETKYVTPRITIVTPYELLRNEASEEIYPLNEECDDSSDAPTHSHLGSGFGLFAERFGIRLWATSRSPRAVLLESLHLRQFRDEVNARIKAREAAMRKSIADDETMIILAETKDSLTLEKGHQAGLFHASTATSATRSNSRELRNTLSVTWIRLLFDLHRLHLHYWPRQQCTQGCEPEDVYTLKHNAFATSDAIVRSAQHIQSPKWDNLARTTIAIIPVESTWDFMPPDVARPLASSTIGHVTVLALRLGMQWRTLDRTRSQMNADGGGFSIASTDVKGLGIMLTFNTFGHPDYNNLVVPSRAADKLMCGIIPGDPDLVREDFDLIDRDRKLIQMWSEGGVYQRLGLDESTVAMLQAQNRWTTHNEVVTLLCAFLPLPRSHLNSFFFSGWRVRQYSVFHFFESRLAILTALRQMQAAHHTDSTRHVMKSLEFLSSQYAYDFWVTTAGTAPTQEDAQQQQLNLTEECAKLFATTTAYFRKHGYQEKNKSSKTWYMQLIAAHARLSAYVNSMTDASQKLSQEEILDDRHDLLDAAGIRTGYFAEHLYSQAKLYADNIGHSEYGIVQYMRYRSLRVQKADGQQYTPSDGDIQDAWWMLMLRGIVWDLSCVCLPYPGEPVISSYYHDETTVWFT